MLISVIIPCYRSEATIERVVEEAKNEILKREGNDYQFVLVNDCSPDHTFEAIRRICEKDKKVVGVDLGRNYGQGTARMAGLQYVTGDVVVCMDDDGQHPADQIYALVDKITEGYDLVYGKFVHKEMSLFRRFSSWANTSLLELTGAKMKGITNSPFLAWSRFSVEALKQYKSPFPSSGAYLMRCTNRVVNVEMVQRHRMEGRSGYTLKKLINLWLTEFTNFTTVPLRVSGIFGMFLVALGFVVLIASLIAKAVNPALSVWLGVLYGILGMLFGVLFMILGLMGEYIGKIYMTVSDLPVFMPRTVLNAKDKE